MTLWVRLAAAAALAFGPRAYANPCKNGGSSFLPDRIGTPGSALPESFLLPCDTMEVGAGDTTRIFSGMRLHFGPKASEKNVILVKGTLIAEGLPGHPVFFSGSRAGDPPGGQPGGAMWGGFKVTASGRLVLKHAGLHNAIVAIDSETEAVRLENVSTTGCRYLIRPGAAFVDLDGKGTDIVIMDFSRMDSAEVTASKKAYPPALPAGAASAAAGKPRIGEKPGPTLAAWLWGGVGIAALGMAGGIWYLMDTRGDGEGSKEELDAPPDLVFPNPE